MRHAVLVVAFPFLAAVIATTVFAQAVEDVYPLEPEDGGTMGPRGPMKIGVKGTDVEKIKFRIEMSKDGFETIAVTFDQTKEPNGWGQWVQGNQKNNPFIYYVREPIPDGDYEWRVSAFNGIDWIVGRKKFTVRVDASPPADVTGIRMIVDKDKKKVVLTWDPVTTDVNGRSEQVALYHVYRYTRRGGFFTMRPYQIGTTVDTRYEDTGDLALKTPMFFYKITAEDTSGNETGRRY